MTEKEKHSDKLFVKELIANDEKAFQKLFDIYAGNIYAYSKSMLKSKEYAEEIVQDVFLRVWLHRDRINPDASFKSYIFTIARNLTLNFLSKAAYDKKLKEEIFYKSQRADNQTEKLVSETEYERLKTQAIAQLPPKRRRIFEMSRNEGRSYEEISKELEISINTVKTQMSKALESIRIFLQKNTDLTLMISLLASEWFYN